MDQLVDIEVDLDESGDESEDDESGGDESSNPHGDSDEPMQEGGLMAEHQEVRMFVCAGMAAGCLSPELGAAGVVGGACHWQAFTKSAHAAAAAVGYCAGWRGRRW
jgi:hypothetical protein